MKKYLLVALIATLINIPNNVFGQTKVDTLSHDGELFEVVLVTAEELRVSSRANYFDLLKAGEVLALHPIPRSATASLWMRMVSGKNNIPKDEDRLRDIYYATHPLTSPSNVEHMLYIFDGNRTLMPIGHIDGSYRKPLSWLGGEKSSWLFLRAVHSPKP
jgi:hypothetical protein